MANIEEFRWINQGNQFILLYLLEPYSHYGNATHFSIAHALELYLKACIVKTFGLTEALKVGHKLFEAFEKLKSDPSFLPHVQITKEQNKYYSVYDSKRKPDEDLRLNIVTVQHLLLPFKYIVDLNYPKF